MLKRRGVLLLELVIAMVVLSVALVGILDGFTASVRAVGAQSDRRIARVLSEQKVNELESEGVFSPGTTQGEFPDFRTFHWTVTTEGTRIASLYRLRVVVSWSADALEVVVYLRERTEG
jgi:Tfp pilus assembly protein PilV